MSSAAFTAPEPRGRADPSDSRSARRPAYSLTILAIHLRDPRDRHCRIATISRVTPAAAARIVPRGKENPRGRTPVARRRRAAIFSFSTYIPQNVAVASRRGSRAGLAFPACCRTPRAVVAANPRAALLDRGGQTWRGIWSPAPRSCCRPMVIGSLAIVIGSGDSGRSPRGAQSRSSGPARRCPRGRGAGAGCCLRAFRQSGPAMTAQRRGCRTLLPGADSSASRRFFSRRPSAR